MKFRVATPCQTFRVLPTINEEGKNRLVVNLKVKNLSFRGVYLFAFFMRLYVFIFLLLYPDHS